MKSKVRRIFVEKKPGFDIEAQSVYNDLVTNLGINSLKAVKVVHRYDIDNLSDEQYEDAKRIILSEPSVDLVYDNEYTANKKNVKVFAVEYLPGQYDQRADSAEQCIQLLTLKDKPTVKTARLVVLEGKIENRDYEKIKEYFINPIESREALLEIPDSLETKANIPSDVKKIDNFTDYSIAQLNEFHSNFGFAMSIEDLLFVQDYFKNSEKRNPTITELKVLDTYWSDHCRHTTFLTKINEVQIESGKYTKPIKDSFDEYKKYRNKLYVKKSKDMSLMDLAVIAMKELKANGKIPDLDESDEINACSVKVEVDIDGKMEDWLIMFKNETHNHPTEIEPFGGAATCLGGAIRDPLSGRSYVYQAMRVTGSGDPRASVKDTIAGKLPQRKITTGAATGYSSYGNQIGLATGQVREIYHEGYVAKRMEIGAVIGATPSRNVRREKPTTGDVIILLGGRTGRDGCGGATGSSKEHTEDSLISCGAEVQKGNAPTERKIQRLFRDPEVSRLIKKCNDFGAGGVCVAIGELAEGLEINLDLVPKKYEGLDGTELAISESQERMAVVVDKNDVEKFIELANQENLEACKVAVVTDSPRLKMIWRGDIIVDISREFLDTNGVAQNTDIKVNKPANDGFFERYKFEDEKLTKETWLENLSNINICSQKGLVERFDSTIGANTVNMPFGGEFQLSPEEAMVAKIPLIEGETTTGTIMSYGFNPEISSWSPYHGAAYAVVESLSKIVAVGGDYKKARLSFQEYFEKLGTDIEKWGKPFSALLGALTAQMKFETPAIGGKDSMSGTFKDMTVPPTLVSFAMTHVNVQNVISSCFKKSNSPIYAFNCKYDENNLPDYEYLKMMYSKIHDLILEGKIISARAVGTGGILEAISKLSFGNKIGISLDEINKKDILYPAYGSFVVEAKEALSDNEIEGLLVRVLGNTIDDKKILFNGIELDLDELIKAWQGTLETVFPTKAKEPKVEKVNYSFMSGNKKVSKEKFAKPRVLIPVFPGTNCEYDTARVFRNAGGEVDVFVLNNLSSNQLEESVKELSKRIGKSQIVALPGGFSAGDEPDGSGKFISTVFRNKYVKESVEELLKNKDGLMIGICNGFQALIKLGLVPFGEIADINENSPTLTFNNIGRHISQMVSTKVVSNLSPWLYETKVGDIHEIAVSHGEGRFVANQDVLDMLMKNGQIATQYVDLKGEITGDIRYNPNGSIFAIEGITSPCGRVFGKMGHSERLGKNVCKNIEGNKEQKIFEAGINYFKS